MGLTEGFLVGTLLGLEVGDDVDLVGLAVGCLVGALLGLEVGDDVDLVGLAVGCFVGGTLGLKVGDDVVGVTEGCLVGALFGLEVGDNVVIVTEGCFVGGPLGGSVGFDVVGWGVICSTVSALVSSSPPLASISLSASTSVSAQQFKLSLAPASKQDLAQRLLRTKFRRMHRYER